MDFEFVILDLIAKCQTDFLNQVLPVISSFANGGIGWIIVSIIFICIPKYRKTGLTMALALIFCFLIGNLTLKPLVGRLRPYSYFPEMTLLIPPLDDFSFPSGHTFSSFASAIAIYLNHRREGLAAFLLAIVIAFSRLYLYVHFPSDIIAGVILGLACGWTANKLVDWYIHKYQPTWIRQKSS